MIMLTLILLPAIIGRRSIHLSKSYGFRYYKGRAKRLIYVSIKSSQLKRVKISGCQVRCRTDSSLIILESIRVYILRNRMVVK